MQISIPLTALEESVLAGLARDADMSPEAVMRQALRVYQKVSIEQARGHRQAFVDANGQLVPERLPMGCPALD